MRPFLSVPLLTLVRRGRLAEGTAAALVVLSLAGCGNDPVSPSVPATAAPELAVAASTPLVFRQVSPGAYHTCGVTVDDLAYCWGEGALGGLGTGGPGPSEFHPVPVAGGLRFQSVNAGTIYACGITTDRLAYCWGLNSSGELGDGTTTTRFAPVRVAGNRKFKVLRAGFRHTCGVTTSNVAYCWGANDEGQLGDGTLMRRLTPVAVAGGHTFAQVSAGGSHTCGATTGHKAYCWGRNEHFELGDGTQTRRLTPTAVSANGLSFDALAVGMFHSCALTIDNRAYCWGDNAVGSLGDGTFGTRTTPWPVTGGRHFDVISVGAIGRHTCGVTAAGLAFCWGYNSSGELGDGTQTNRPMPVKVLGP